MTVFGERKKIVHICTVAVASDVFFLKELNLSFKKIIKMKAGMC